MQRLVLNNNGLGVLPSGMHQLGRLVTLEAENNQLSTLDLEDDGGSTGRLRRALPMLRGGRTIASLDDAGGHAQSTALLQP